MNLFTLWNFFILFLLSSEHMQKNQQKQPLQLASYIQQKQKWPSSGQHILAQFDHSTIIVYQAYNPQIAKAVLESQCFHSEACKAAGYNMYRMTWIKPNFLWMMYRSGWATKKDQQRILAIRLKREGFEEMLAKAVLSRVNQIKGQKPSRTDQVRLQWDPDHDPRGFKHQKRRAIQLGLRGGMLEKMSKSMIVRIYDITSLVEQNRKHIEHAQGLLIPLQQVYRLDNKQLCQQIGIENQQQEAFY